MPLISVITPTFNSAAYIAEAIESVRGQTHEQWELIIVDDGSEDQTSAIVASYLSDPRIRFHLQGKLGPASARNCGVALSRGDTICFLDADDLFLPDKLTRSLEAFDSSPDVVYSAIWLIDDAGREIRTFQFGTALSKENFFAQMLFRNLVIPSATMARRRCAVQEPFIERMIGLEDYELFLRWAARFVFKYVPEPLVKYRRHRRSLSRTMHESEVEKQIVKAYGWERIQEAVQRTSYTENEKKLLYGKILFKIDAYPAAMEVLEGLEHPLAFFYLGNCLLALAKEAEAEKAFVRAIQLDHHNAAVHNNLGVLYARRAAFAEAEQQFKEALKLRSGYNDPQQNLVLLRREKGAAPAEWRITRLELRESLMYYET